MPSLYCELFFATYKIILLNRRKPESNCLLRQKNTTKIILIHKGTKLVKDLEGKFRLQTMNLKIYLTF